MCVPLVLVFGGVSAANTAASAQVLPQRLPLCSCQGRRCGLPWHRPSHRQEGSTGHLVLADFDPEGEDIGRSFAQSMRDDFGISNIVPVKVALTGAQVKELDLPPNCLTREKKSSRKGRFVQRHGEASYELEAVPTATLQQYLGDAIGAVIDVKAFNAEIDREKHDAAYLDGVRRQAHAVLGKLGTDGGQHEDRQ